LYDDIRADFTPAFGSNFTGWGVSWPDLDLDGDPDLVLANGAIPVTKLRRDAQPIQVLEDVGAAGKPAFADAGRVAGMETAPLVNGRGLAVADYDNDGDLDIAVNTIGGSLVLLRNEGPATGHWLEVRLGSFVPGATIEVTLPDGRTLSRELHAGGSYLSSEDPRAHFGLGGASQVREVRVRFPSGAVRRVRDVTADQLLTVVASPEETRFAAARP
jgi:hypothetical protein